MSSTQFVGDVLRAFTDSFQPLTDGLTAAPNLSAFLADFGWSLDPGSDINAVATALRSVSEALAAVQNAVAELDTADTGDDSEAIAKAVAKLSVAIKDVCIAIHTLSTVTAVDAWPSPLSLPHFWTDFPVELLGYLLFRYLERHAPRVFAPMRLVGVLTEDYCDIPSKGRVPYVRRGVRWDRLIEAISRPQDIMADVYGWGGAFQVHRLMDNLRGVAVAFDLSAVLHDASERLLDAYYAPACASRREAYELSVPVFWKISDTGDSLAMSMLELAVLPIPPSADRSAVPVGLAVYPRVTGTASQTFQLTPSVSVQVKGGFVSEAAIRAEIRPGDAKVFVDPLFSGRVDASLVLDAKPVTPWIPLGHASSSRLEIAHVHAGLKATGLPPDIEFIIEAAADDAKLVIDFGEGDGFLQQVLGKTPKILNLSLAVGWSSKHGVQFGGQAQLEVTLPVHQSIGGVIDIAAITIAFGAGTAPPGASLNIGVSGGLKLGPVAATVERVGVQAKLLPAPAGTPGNLGGVALDWAFLPPKGVGLVIKAAAVTGGGYLFMDPEKGKYGGVLAVSIKGTLQLKAIGLITTKLLDGSPGFSFIIIVTVDFSPIQLGYGFTLNGVGGLAAFNRTMNVDALRDGIKNHTLDSIMFPPDPVANAAKIISDLESVFPVAPGRFVFAPMVKIAWGKSILLIEVGLAVELPSPLRLAILGKVHLLLPPSGDEAGGESKKAVEIHLDVLGILDLDRNEISVDAVLYDSRLAIFPITGGMALRIKWGSDPVFLLAIGGFNPRFAPPPGFPTLDRVGIQLAYDKNGLRAGLLLTSYVAVTSSTVQFGARIDAYAEVSIAKIAGYLGFDALVEMAPFHIIVDVYGGVTVRAFGIGFSCDLLLTLTAFDPVTGDGHLTIDFFGKHEVPIHFAIGDAKPLPALPVADPLAELVTALSDIRNWSAALPMGAGMLVTFRQPTADEIKASAGQVLAHPMGELSVRQKVLPFDIGIDRFGAAVPMSRGPFAISEATFGAQTSVVSDKTAKLRDSFARGQFVTLSEDDKLTGPQFESFVNGYAGLGTDQVRLVAPQTVAFDYDVLVIDSLGEQTQRPLPSVTLSYGAMLRTTQFSASKAGSVDVGAPERFTGASKGISVVAPKYKVISVDQADPNDKTEFDTWTQADEKRRTGAKVSQRQVVESHEFA